MAAATADARAGSRPPLHPDAIIHQCCAPTAVRTSVGQRRLTLNAATCHNRQTSARFPDLETSSHAPQKARSRAGKAALCAGARRLRLLSVTGFPSASVLGWQSSRLPTDHVGMAKVSRPARCAQPCRRQMRAFGRTVSGSYQPSSLSRLSSMPKWWAISWMTVRRTWSSTSCSVRQMAQIAGR